MPLQASTRSESSSQKIVCRPDGSVVLKCESGNPRLGVIFTPADDGQLIVTMPGEDGHPLSAVNVLLGSEQISALGNFIRRRPKRP
jgi:hypothetical protein